MCRNLLISSLCVLSFSLTSYCFATPTLPASEENASNETNIYESELPANSAKIQEATKYVSNFFTRFTQILQNDKTCEEATIHFKQLISNPQKLRSSLKLIVSVDEDSLEGNYIMYDFVRSVMPILDNDKSLDLVSKCKDIPEFKQSGDILLAILLEVMMDMKKDGYEIKK